jgi:hypothetical protein
MISSEIMCSWDRMHPSGNAKAYPTEMVEGYAIDKEVEKADAQGKVLG